MIKRQIILALSVFGQVYLRPACLFIFFQMFEQWILIQDPLNPQSKTLSKTRSAVKHMQLKVEVISKVNLHSDANIFWLLFCSYKKEPNFAVTT